MAWTAPRTWVASEVVTAAIMNTHIRDNQLAMADRIQCVYKTTDQTINNSAVQTNDTQLKFTVVSGQTYLFLVNLVITAASATPDITVGFTFPTGTMTWLGIGLDTAATTVTASGRVAGTAGAASGTNIAFGVPTITSGLLINGSFLVSAGGTVQLQWSQNTATAANTTVNAGSSLQATRVSI